MTVGPSDTTSGATPEHRLLDRLQGRWRTRGRVLANTSGEEVEIAGSDCYEWMSGGHFMLHWVDVSIGEERVHNLEVIGYDAATGCYPTRFFDHTGNTGRYIPTVANDVWAFSTEGPRATLELSAAGHRMKARWERRDDGG
jgi:hypothetical protein